MCICINNVIKYYVVKHVINDNKTRKNMFNVNVIIKNIYCCKTCLNTKLNFYVITNKKM